VAARQTLGDAGLHMAFEDQGSNLAGKFFQFSLAPYLAFLLFLKNKGRNAIPDTAFFGFQARPALSLFRSRHVISLVGTLRLVSGCTISP